MSGHVLKDRYYQSNIRRIRHPPSDENGSIAVCRAITRKTDTRHKTYIPETVVFEASRNTGGKAAVPCQSLKCGGDGLYLHSLRTSTSRFASILVEDPLKHGPR